MPTTISLTANGRDHSHVLVNNFLWQIQLLIEQHKLPEPSEEIKQCIVRIAQALLPLDIPSVPPAPTTSDDYAHKKAELEYALQQVGAYDPQIAQQALAYSILQFILALPRPEHPLWSSPAKGLLPLGPTIARMMMPFYKVPSVDKLFKSVRDRYEQGARIVQEKTKAKDWVWPENYNGPDMLTLYLIPEFQELFDCKVPFGIKQENRQTHQWIMAKWGAGKTTLLSAQIAADLERVARNECSIMVMDSQNTLVPDIARLKLFAPGQPLHDRLIYIEPSMKFPPALNIFDRNAERFKGLDEDKQYELDMATFEMMEFFLSSLLEFNLTSKQNVPFKFILPAVLSVPNATLRTLQEMLKDDGWKKYKDKVVGLDPEVIDWFEEHYREPAAAGGRTQRKDVYAESREEIYYRIEGIYADRLFRRMFAQPRKKLDLFEQLQNGKVILINTKKGVLRKGVEPWGRFFIAQLLQAVEERSLVARADNLPVYCYIDEAGDYIAKERNIEKIFTQARKQLVSMVLAHHKPSDIKEPAVWEALNDAGIRVSPVSRGVFHFQVPEEKIDTVIQVPPIFFEKQDRMSQEEWNIVLAEQRAKWCVARDGADPRTPDPEEPRIEDVERPDSFEEE